MQIKNFEWLPLYSSKMIIFNRTGEKINGYPIIISELDDQIYFIKMEFASYKIHKTNRKELAEHQQDYIDLKQAIILHPSNNLKTNIQDAPFFNEDFIIDTTSIFVMNKEDFIKLYPLNEFDNLMKNTRTILYQTRLTILEMLQKNISNNAFSLTYIKLIDSDNYQFIPELIYSSNEFINKERWDIVINHHTLLRTIDKYIDNYRAFFNEERYIKYKEKLENLISNLVKATKNSFDYLKEESTKNNIDLLLLDQSKNLSWYENEIYDYKTDNFIDSFINK